LQQKNTTGSSLVIIFAILYDGHDADISKPFFTTDSNSTLVEKFLQMQVLALMKCNS